MATSSTSGSRSRRRPAKRDLFLRCIYGFGALALGAEAYHCLKGYSQGAPPSMVGRRWGGWPAPLYTTPEQALVLAVVFGVAALVFAYFALHPSSSE